MTALRIARIEAQVYRAPIANPVQTSFGVMRDRPAVLVRIEDYEGAVGWGEIWCNFPTVGAEHRARILESCVAPILLERVWSDPEQAFAEVTRRLHVLSIQTAEPGPIAQAIAGADIALWDLLGKRQGQPLWRLLGGAPEVQTYASGLNPTDPEILAATKRDEGYTAFKLKVGFGAERDLRNLQALRDLLGAHATLMVDANQAWSLDEAIVMSQRIAGFHPLWLEEPILADSSPQDWQKLARATPVPLAGGENILGENNFDAAIAAGALSVIQPDPGKWGGFSGCLPVARRAVANDRMFCPHWLGGGVGLVASCHLKAAVGGPGFVEVDANPNPLRDLIARPALARMGGSIRLSDRPGLGLSDDWAAIAGFRRAHEY
ncbi:MAG: mandelate racemase/muconate lactonizing enzyme family protein [Burkholderiales bacterium]